MKKITFRYFTWFWCHDITRQVPENYAEMTPAQFLATVRLSQGWIDEQQFFKQFFRLKDNVLAKLDLFQLYQLVKQMDFLKTIHDSVSFFYCPSLPGKLFAPDSKLSGMSFQQFMMVDTFFSWYLAYEKEHFLNQFIAALYLKKDESYFVEPGKKTLDMQRRVSEVRNIPFDLKYSVLVNWVLIKKWLSSAYPSLFPAGEENVNAQGDKVKSKPVDWLSLFDTWVGDNVAYMDSYRSMPCMDAIRLLNRKIKESKK